MTRLFDGRHKWGEEFVVPGKGFARTCSVCGRTDTYDTFIPRVFLEALVEHISRPNPYRELFGQVYGGPR